MSIGWQEKAFEECIEPVKYTAKIQRKDFQTDGRFPIVSQEADFINGYWDDEVDVFRVKKPLVVFGDHTKVLKYVDFDFVLGADGVKLLPPRDFLSPKFFYYQLQSNDLDALGYARHYRLLKESKIAFPPLPEQRRIVGILDEAFAGIATAKANAEKNLRSARELFESHLQAVFNQCGERWRAERLEHLTENESPITYGVVKPGEEGDIRFVRGGDLVRGSVRLTQLRTITRSVSDQYRRTLLRGGELLICLVGQPGQVAVAPAELAGANIARQVGLIRLKQDVNAEFVRYYLQSAPGAESLGARESGSVQQVINLGELRQVSVPCPVRSEQDAVVAKLDEMGDETTQLESLFHRKLATLDELKKSLLHQAFTGQL